MSNLRPYKQRALSMLAARHLVLAIGLIGALLSLARGQQNTVPAAPTPTAVPSPTSSPVANVAPIPIAEVVTQAEAVSGSLRNIESDLATDQVTSTIESELPALTSEIDARLDENAKILNSRPSLETLRNLELDWKTLADKLVVWRRDLTARATALDKEIDRLNQTEKTWTATLAQLTSQPQSEGSAVDNNSPTEQQTTPPEILQRISDIIRAVKQTRLAVEKRRAQILTLQNRVAEQDGRIAAAVGAINQVREATINRLFVKDSPPIWNARVWSRAGQDLLLDSQNSFSTQWTALKAYARRQVSAFVVHGVIFLLLVATLYWARRRVARWVAEEPALEGVARVFNIPVATAAVLSIMLAGWLYPQAPRLLSAILGAAALVPTVIILRQLVARHLFPILNALVVFYFIDLLRSIATSLPLLSRLFFLGEMLGGLIFLAWLTKSGRLSLVGSDARRRSTTTIEVWAKVAGLVFIATLLANSLGYTSIASLVGNALLESAYIAIIFFAAVRIADGLIMFALRMRPLSQLGMVRRHRPLLRRRIQKFLRWVAVLLWIVYTLELLSLRAPIVGNIRAALTARLEVGSLHVSLANILAFVLTVWLSFLLSRFIRFLLEEDIYPRISLARGVPYAVSTTLHYVILFVGFLIAVAAMGIDMTKFTILAGAFGVGLGFGLQNIVNNFVSGLILLFERPVNVGDMIQVGEREGELRRIGLRASVIRTLEGSEVIVPNGQLISEEVLNWTLSDQQRRMEVDVGVEYGTDPELVIELLTKMAAKHPDVMEQPSPDTLFVGFGDSSLNFRLRAWTMHFSRWMQIRSELTVGINSVLRDAGINIPFPQRDLHLKTTEPAVSSGSNNLVAAEKSVSEATDLGSEE